MGALARRFPLLSPALFIRRKAIIQGFLGDNRLWQVIGVIVFGRMILRKVMGGGAQTLAVERLEPGQQIILTGLRIDE
ncbi:MAG: hypothetical protein ACRDZ2_04900 [Ilumatobacteraceae bacterium]